MSLRDKILKKGVPGIRGIKPVHPAEKKCTKTVTKLGRPRYICPPSGGKEAVSSLENLPVKPEDVPRKLHEISTLAPEQKFTPKQQREEPEKIKEALFRAPKTLHLKETIEAGPDKVQDNLHFKEPEEAGPDKVHDHLHLKEPEEAGPKKSKNKKDDKKKDSEEDDVNKSLFICSEVYFRKSFRSLADLRKAVYVRDKSGNLVSGASLSAPRQSRKEQRAGEQKFKTDQARQKFLVGEKKSKEDLEPGSFSSWLSDNSEALMNLALWLPGGAAASQTGKLASGAGSILSDLAKKYGLKVVEVAADAARTPVMVAMMSLPGPAAKNVISGAGRSALGPSPTKYALVASSKEMAEKAAKELTPTADKLINVNWSKTASAAAQGSATKKPSSLFNKLRDQTRKVKNAQSATKEAAEEASKKLSASESAKVGAGATAAAVGKLADATSTEAPAAESTTKPADKPVTKTAVTPARSETAQEQTQTQESTTGEGIGSSRPSKPKRTKTRRTRVPLPTSSDKPRKKKRAELPRSPKKAAPPKSAGQSARRRALAALETARKEHAQAKTKRGAYQRVGREKQHSEIQARVGSQAKFNKSMAFVAPYARQVLSKKMSLMDALEKVPWHMQDDLLQYLRSKKKR